MKSTIVVFELSMPNRGSWNGGWNGASNYYAIVKNIGASQKAAKRAQKLVEEGPYGYNFGDGWRAQINVREVGAAEARKLRAKTQGFCGYDWMVTSILAHGEIKS